MYPATTILLPLLSTLLLLTTASPTALPQDQTQASSGFSEYYGPVGGDGPLNSTTCDVDVRFNDSGKCHDYCGAFNEPCYPATSYDDGAMGSTDGWWACACPADAGTT